MLLPKPIIEIKKLNKAKLKANPLMNNEDDDLENDMELNRKLNPSAAKNSSDEDNNDQHGGHDV